MNSPGWGGDWGTKENLAGLPCGDPNNYNDRLLPLVAGDTTIKHCFGTCDSDGSCPAPPASFIDITFTLNVSSITSSGGTIDPTGMFLAGGGNFGNPGDFPMIDLGNDVWSITVTKPTGFSSDYTFTNGNCSDWSCKEDISGLSCAVAPYNDRHLAPVYSDTTITHCFGSCDTCSNIVDPPYCFSSDSIYQSICYGDSILINGSYQFNSGYFNDTLFLADINGCDSIVTTVVSLLNPVVAYNDTVFLTGCDSILWKGKIYTVSGNYFDTIYSGAANGCDSLIPLYLTINNCSSCNTVYYLSLIHI